MPETRIGFTPDVPPVYEELTVRQFLRFVGKGYDLSAAETRERTDFWLEKVWLTDKADQKIKALSRGMKQRIGIARTLLPNPALVLLDEPAAGLDPAGRVQFRQLLVDLRDPRELGLIDAQGNVIRRETEGPPPEPAAPDDIIPDEAAIQRRESEEMP